MHSTLFCYQRDIAYTYTFIHVNIQQSTYGIGLNFYTFLLLNAFLLQDNDVVPMTPATVQLDENLAHIKMQETGVQSFSQRVQIYLECAIHRKQFLQMCVFNTKFHNLSQNITVCCWIPCRFWCASAPFYIYFLINKKPSCLVSYN